MSALCPAARAATFAFLAAATIASAESINPPTTPQTSPAMNDKEKSEPQDRARLVARGDRGRPPRAHDEVPGRGLHPAQPERADGPRGVRELLPERGRREAEESDSRRRCSAAPVVTGAKGDFVFLIFEHGAEAPDATRRQTYRSTRSRSCASRTARCRSTGTARSASQAAGRARRSRRRSSSRSRIPSAATPARSRPKRRGTSRSASMELKDMLQYGHLELADKVMDPGYIQHNPNVPQGRDGFKQLHEPHAGPHAAGDQARMGAPAVAHARERPVRRVHVGPHRQGSRTIRRANTFGTTSTSCASRTG